MSESVVPANSQPGPVMVELFDPPMCCSTGICGPAVDQALIDVNAVVLDLRASGIGVERYQMNTHSSSFLRNAEVMRLVREREMAALPITAVNGRVIKTGTYPTLTEVRAALQEASA